MINLNNLNNLNEMQIKKTLKTLLRIGGLCVAAVVFTGCANVSATQRGILAKPDMQFDTDVANSKIIQHTYASKEGTAGGRATGGGGCGCT